MRGGGTYNLEKKLPQESANLSKSSDQDVARDSIKSSSTAALRHDELHQNGADSKTELSCAETTEKSAAPDLGFRVFRVDSSNFKPSYYTPEALSQDLLSDLEGNIKEDRTDLDLLFACVLDGKMPLSCPYAELQLAGHKVYSYNHGDLLACFESEVGSELISAIADLKTQPLLLVLRDSCFAASASKINLSELCKTLLSDVTLKVL